MKECLFCNEMSEDRIQICDCGYNFEKGEITDGNKIKHWIADPEEWSNKIERQKKVHDFQKEHYNVLHVPNDSFPQWSERKLAKLLYKKYYGHLSLELRLAEAFSKHPELKKCKNKTNAIRKLNELKGKSSLEGEETVFEDEGELQNYLEKNWDISPFGNEWTLKHSKFKTKKIGEIDLLAKNKEGNKWLVIELKKDQASDETVGQILRYMGYVKRHMLNSKDEVVMGLIVAGTFDKQILYALGCCPEISIKKYSYYNDGIEFVDIDIDLEIGFIDFVKLTPNKQKAFIEDLQKLRTEQE